MISNFNKILDTSSWLPEDLYRVSPHSLKRSSVPAVPTLELCALSSPIILLVMYVSKLHVQNNFIITYRAVPEISKPGYFNSKIEPLGPRNIPILVLSLKGKVTSE